MRLGRAAAYVSDAGLTEVADAEPRGCDADLSLPAVWGYRLEDGLNFGSLRDEEEADDAR